MPYSSIHTTYGLNALAAAEASGTSINITAVAIGDGGGNDITPDPSMTTLTNEVYRATVNKVTQNASDTTRYTVQAIVPATSGGYTIREIALFDADGGMLTIGNLPATYKPTSSEGSYSDMVFNVEIIASNASIITLTVDPNVAVATQNWIINNITVSALIPGGTTGQFLAKESNSDGDVIWKDPGEFTIYVDTVHELQTLAAGQTTVTWIDVTTTGLAVYVEGNRLNPNEWSKSLTEPLTKITLSQSYPAGYKIEGIQNDPLGTLPDPLEKAKNLSDIPNVATARANLSVFSQVETRQMAPSGEVAFFAMSLAPAGWLKANGAAISRTTYADLFAAIGTTFGAGDGYNTFNIPDLRGEFIRGWDDSRGTEDSGRSFGSWQGSQNGAHTHSGTTNTTGSHTHGVPEGISNDVGAYLYTSGDDYTSQVYTWSSTTAAGDHSHSFTTSSSGGSEVRVRNRALLVCIKY